MMILIENLFAIVYVRYNNLSVQAKSIKIIADYKVNNKQRCRCSRVFYWHCVSTASMKVTSNRLNSALIAIQFTWNLFQSSSL